MAQMFDFLKIDVLCIYICLTSVMCAKLKKMEFPA